MRPKRPTAPKAGLTTDAIVAAAIELADAEGLAAVSMGRVANRLGYTPMSLYRHVPSKEALLALVGEQLSVALLLSGYARNWARLATRPIDTAASPSASASSMAAATMASWSVRPWAPAVARASWLFRRQGDG